MLLFGTKEAAKGAVRNGSGGSPGYQPINALRKELHDYMGDMWNVRSDLNRAAGDLYRQASQNSQQVVEKLAKLQDIANEHGETLKQILQVLKQMGGL